MSLEGTTVVVTGASQGLGLATAQGLARQGAALVLVSRDPERARQARAEVSAASGNARIETCLADLSSLASVRELAARLIALPGRLGVLINNAAVATPVRQQTVDGFELQFALNHLAPFLLTNLLRDRLVADAPARVVTVSSRVHAHGAIHFDDLQGTHDYSGARAYNQSKLANVLFTYELARRLAGTGVTANCLHPGVAPTNLNRFLAPNRPPSGGPAPPFALRLRRALHRRLDAWRRGPSRRVMTVEEASRTAIHLASEPDLAGITGAYFVGRRQTRSSAQSYDAALAARLWEVSETLTGLRPAR